MEYLKVLIESDWNLKVLRWATNNTKLVVLIESDWNLKGAGYHRPSAGEICINRIRLEFKGSEGSTGYMQVLAVLIESDWNLKHKEDRHRFPGCRRINRIRLEFKANKLNDALEDLFRINRIRLEFKAEGQTAGLLGI